MGLSHCSNVTVSTLIGARHVDVDDFYWMLTNPLFTSKRPPSERVSLIQQKFSDEDGVLTGSCMAWGDALIAHVDLIVFVVTPTPVRLERLAGREKQRFGNRIAPGGDMHGIHLAFREWASQYDDPSFSVRNRAWHEAWLLEQTAPVLRIDGTKSPEKMAADVIRHA
ncbi:adenylate kinase [Pseudomonas violetae]|uniref:Adenylate kinase n=1 Tax=Pseudomonas violetae TaxID=2915813 RepID=A0ABT0EZ69_9PSED|nr:adenylate kinase [Pseudomonas violetae]MCK1791041.1 adenylate kinase [Pseudomonas violetae]